LVWTAIDVEELMLESELFALLDHTADAAYVVTEAGRICAWNAAAERLFGYPAAEALGRDVDTVLQARDTLGTAALAGGAEGAARRADAVHEGTPDFDLQVCTADGRRIWINVSTLDFDNPRTGQRLIVRLARDVTARRERELLLQRMIAAGRELAALATDAGEAHAPVDPLTDQERRVLTAFARGSNAAGVARELRIAPNTLRNHLHRINRKLRTHSRLEAVTHARRRGLID
jgi:PAS domain S-box-containing protein